MSSGGSKKVTIGYKYYVGVHAAICLGPVDAVTRLTFGDRTGWTGSVTSNGSIEVSKPTLFGGDKKEGGVEGTVDVMMGGATQGRNSYLVSQLGGNIPAYRGLLSLVFHRGSSGFYWSAMNPYIKPVAVTVRRILKGWSNDTPWYSAKAAIGVNMNPIHIIVQAMTDPDWGMAYPTSILGDTFTEAADVCYNEGFGLSLMWTQQMSIQDFVKLILQHIEGTIFLDRTTGKFEVKLFRDGYDIGALPVLDPSNIAELNEYQRAAWGETVNEIVVEYTDPTNEAKATVAVQDLANIKIQGAVVSNKRSYPGIRSQGLAYRVAERDLNAASVPVAAVKLTLLRGTVTLKHGDLFRLSWPEYDLVEVVFRVLKADYGPLDSPHIVIDAVEDIFALPTNVYGDEEDSLWTSPDTVPALIASHKMQELTHYEVFRAFSSGDFAQLVGDEAFPVFCATRPAVQNQTFRAYASPLPESNPSAAYASIMQGGVYTPSVDASGSVSELALTVPFDNALEVPWEGSVSIYAFWDDEIIEITNIDTAFSELIVKRGVLDSVPQAHADGSRIWMYNGEYGAEEGVFDYTNGETAYFKQVGVSSGVDGDVDAADETAHTFTARWYRPWPPANVTLDGDYFPASVATRGFQIEWVGRDRLSQDTGFTEWTAGHITPEAGTTYTLRVYNTDRDTLVATYAGLTTTITGGDELISLAGTAITTCRAELRAVRGGTESEFAFDHIFAVPCFDSCLLHFEGADLSTTFTDDSGKTWTRTGTPVISTSQFQFGAASGRFDAANRYITSPAHDEFDLTADFTVECWFRTGATIGAAGIWTLGSGVTDVARIQLDTVNVAPSPSVSVRMKTDTGSYTATSAAGVIVAATWHHIAVTRAGNTLRVFVDGALAAATTVAGKPLTDKKFRVGQTWAPGSSSNAAGYIDEFRVRKGEALYTAPFTPPAAPFVYVAP